MYLSPVATYDVIIIGGGLAGLTAAIHLRKEHHRILLLEKETYPHHKVCGEYLSNEVVPYLHHLGIELPTNIEINTLEFSTQKGRSLQLSLPLGAIGISRYALDNCLYKRATSLGVDLVFCSAESIEYKDDIFTVKNNLDQEYKATFVIGGFGKRSNLDKMLRRDFISKKSPWLGVKAHYQWNNFPDNLVGLHSFEGGYGGLSKTETGAVNFCYLVTYNSFQKKHNISEFNDLVVAQNPYLGTFLKEATMVFEKPLSIAQISFEAKDPVEDHVIMCGDSAGLIHPLCGNGMAMAIHSAKIASELIHAYLKEGLSDRTRLEKEYTIKWYRTFGKRIRTGRRLQKLLMSPKIAELLFSLAILSPGILKSIIKKTHGKPIEV
ncbi:NAD(P)/FAD-dependent oxidoreductase [uncultured Muriicola sp.]|uniref:NAD(P)/FAD-dependent oxidoreductase n=1 Tax=uncultured Muriicola sp. TaxID=1583102 RepID=UPI00261BB047|nr:NAD(P)/FAD-dependent oxidoreductase [uncultured Muriicola sp.]